MTIEHNAERSATKPSHGLDFDHRIQLQREMIDSSRRALSAGAKEATSEHAGKGGHSSDLHFTPIPGYDVSHGAHGSSAHHSKDHLSHEHGASHEHSASHRRHASHKRGVPSEAAGSGEHVAKSLSQETNVFSAKPHIPADSDPKSALHVQAKRDTLLPFADQQNGGDHPVFSKSGEQLIEQAGKPTALVTPTEGGGYKVEFLDKNGGASAAISGFTMTPDADGKGGRSYRFENASGQLGRVLHTTKPSATDIPVHGEAEQQVMKKLYGVFNHPYHTDGDLRAEATAIETEMKKMENSHRQNH